MLSSTNKYRDIDVDIKKLYKKEIMKNIEIKKQATPKKTIKVYKLSEKDEKEVYKLVNRDILRNDGMKRIELGDEFQIGTFVKEKKKTIS